ncbi:hypothetical protein HPB49_015172 [Dermacentor silvarum]|uniref:Uncharacterized protein n=1 Tax=Dermacentor silvarum TaxID=543639 RepID=A0ACB8CA47_DERSI|nr:hypothetical protein HPB49_015172 [Dermacentor silvarum]
MVFVVITMGGMMAGFTLGFANHYGHASPLERNTLSNVAGYILVLTSHLMVFGSSLMLLSAGIFMLMGCIGDIYLCRAQRSYYQGDAEPLKDLKIVEFQTDLVHHYKIDIRALVEEITGRWSIVKEFWDLFNKTDLLFDNIGVCSNIVDIFTDGFNIICNGMIDFVNGYWLSIMILVGIYVYGIYISLTASKYLYTMESYTYEGEPVPPDQIHKRQRARKK